MNLEIQNWCRDYSYFLYKNKSCYDLDLYIYKLLWRFLKRCHPRRSHSWIYLKYWKNISGNWRFIYYDSIKKVFHFLSLHSYIEEDFISFPILLNTFLKKNYKKLFNTLFLKKRPYFKGIHKLLFIKQKGLCNSCLKPINFSNNNIIKILNNIFLKEDSINKVFLLHSYCC